MTKSELRKLYLEKRKNLSKEQVRDFSKKIFENFILQFKVIENQKVHIFLTIEKFNEVDTKYFLDYFFENKNTVFVPKMINDELISIELNAETEFDVNSWGIKEPKSNEDATIKSYDIVITPLLYCDQYGNRIGYGKGFYDRFFSKISSKTIKVGLAFFPPNELTTDVTEYDIPLDYLVTPDEILSFKGLL